MRIAILGATSTLAADFVAHSLRRQSSYRFTLFARTVEQIEKSIRHRGVETMPECRSLDAFGDGEWDAIVNFIGVGDPARAVAMGADILRITRDWDDRALDHVRRHRNCRYIFLSSGAALGLSAAQPGERGSKACFAINDLAPSAYYGVSKFYSEVMHRASSDLSIIDIRIFNYISQFANLEHKFFINEAIAAIKGGVTLGVNSDNIRRDYIGEHDFANLMTSCLHAPTGYNGAIDAYSNSPTSKYEVLEVLTAEFGLNYSISGGGIDATGSKSDYFSNNYFAEILGYRPRFSSIDTIRTVIRHILAC